jgi:hypothetical protein
VREDRGRPKKCLKMRESWKESRKSWGLPVGCDMWGEAGKKKKKIVIIFWGVKVQVRDMDGHGMSRRGRGKGREGRAI